MCHVMQLFVLLVLGWLLADKLDTAVLALQTGDEMMVIAKGWEIVSTLWMLPVMGFVFAMFLVMLFNRLTGGKNVGCCGTQGCEMPENAENELKIPEK